MDQNHSILTIEELYNLLESRNIFYVTLRNGKRQLLKLEEISDRITKLAFETKDPLNKQFVNVGLIVQKVCQGMYDGVTTTVLDELAAETCAYMNIIHPHYSKLAARIAVSNLHKETKNSFSETIFDLHNYQDDQGRNASLISTDVYEIVMKNADKINKEINQEQDYTYDFFGFKTLERSYLLKVNKKIVERPQYMLMRVSIGIHKENLEQAFITYHMMSQKWFTHATPTLFNAGTVRPQMSSCFLVDMKDDSIEGIYDTLKTCALISKSAGGIGITCHKIRAKDSYIKGTNGISNGIIPMLKVFNDTARYVDQGGGKRKGSFAMYLEPWHPDVEEFISIRKNHGKEEIRARDLFPALWIPDLFMKRVIQDLDWTYMCPNECPRLQDTYGEEFNQLYEEYERTGKGRKTIKARQLWHDIVDAQIETGTPFILYKDACNQKSNQKNLGTIKSSNLCTEVVQYTDQNEVAVCNLASICLPKFVDDDGVFDYEKLQEVVSQITYNLNRVIDNNYYPIKEAETSNKRHRPIGIGVQGLADAFVKMKVAYESQKAMDLNEKIFETIYYAACKRSMEIAQIEGQYETFQGSPASQGQLQFDLWGYKPRNGFDWDSLKIQIKKHGLRNSLLVAPMPTASTSQIMGNTESFEPLTSNLYTRRVLSGEFVCINQYLVQDLIDRNLWTVEVKNQLIQFNGSVQKITQIPDDLKQLYKTVWEISQKKIVEAARSRGCFIDQSQSLNIHIAEPNYSKMCSMHFYAWEQGLKTGMYYLRTRPAADPIKFTLDVETLLHTGGDIEIKNKEQIKLDKPRKKLKPVVEPQYDVVKDDDGNEYEVCLNCGS